MIMLSILAMTALVFFSRYIFLEPRVPLKLNQAAQRFLSYSSTAVLTAISAPILFFPEGEFQFSATNPYLLAALITIAIMWKTKNILLSVMISMAIFLVLNLYLFAV